MQILVVGSETHACNATECIIAVQGHFRVNQGRWFWYQSKARRLYDFLLVINSMPNLCRISHRFGDTATYWSKIAISYPPHPHSTPLLGVTPSNFGMNLISAETGMMGPPYGEEIMIVGRTVWTQSTSVTDGRTDGQTDRQTDRITITMTVQHIASHGKNTTLIKAEK